MVSQAVLSFALASLFGASCYAPSVSASSDIDSKVSGDHNSCLLAQSAGAANPDLACLPDQTYIAPMDISDQIRLGYECFVHMAGSNPFPITEFYKGRNTDTDDSLQECTTIVNGAVAGASCTGLGTFMETTPAPYWTECRDKAKCKSGYSPTGESRHWQHDVSGPTCFWAAQHHFECAAAERIEFLSYYPEASHIECWPRCDAGASRDDNGECPCLEEGFVRVEGMCTPGFGAFQGEWKVLNRNFGDGSHTFTSSIEFSTSYTEEQSSEFVDRLESSNGGEHEAKATLEMGYGGITATVEGTTSSEWSSTAEQSFTSAAGATVQIGEKWIQTFEVTYPTCHGTLYQFSFTGTGAVGKVVTTVPTLQFQCVRTEIEDSYTTDTSPKCPPSWCNGESDCQCCRSDSWAAEADRHLVNVCPEYSAGDTDKRMAAATTEGPASATDASVANDVSVGTTVTSMEGTVSATVASMDTTVTSTSSTEGPASATDAPLGTAIEESAPPGASADEAASDTAVIIGWALGVVAIVMVVAVIARRLSGNTDSDACSSSKSPASTAPLAVVAVVVDDVDTTAGL